MRWWVGAFSGGVLACASLGGATTASAAVAVGVSASVPEVVAVGNTVPASLTVSNANSGDEVSLTNTLSTLALVPSCGQPAAGPDCAVPFRDAGVLVPSAIGTGRVGTACANAQFSISLLPDVTHGKYAFASQLPVLIPPSAACSVDFTLSVVRVPAIDANVSQPGLQTDQLASAAVSAPGGLFATGFGGDETTVGKGLPALSTQVSPAQLTLGQSFIDTATIVTGGAGAASDRHGDVQRVPGRVGLRRHPGPDVEQRPQRCRDRRGLRPPEAGRHRGLSRRRDVQRRRQLQLGRDVLRGPVGGRHGDQRAAASAASAAGPPPPPPPPIAGSATPVITTIASAGIVLGGQIRDTATITGRANPSAGATVEFRLYGPGDSTCAGIPAFVTTAPVSAVGIATSAFFTPTRAGVYRWRAFYSGDANNVAVSTACNAPNETVSVSSADAPQITATSFETPPRVGQTTLLKVEAVDPGAPISGLQVNFDEARGLSGMSACRVSVLGPFSTSPAILRIPRVFREAGQHDITIEVLSGDCTGALRRSATTMRVDVLPPATARRTARGARGGALGARSAAAASTCRDRFLSPTSAATRARVANAVLCLVNVERRKRGRRALLRSPRLQRASSAHTSDMIRRRYFEHERAPGGPQLASRLRRAGYRGRTYAENIGYGSDYNASLMVAAWMNSPGHKGNILHPRLRYAGVGLTTAIPVAPQRPGSTYTMDFGATLR